MSTLLSCSSCQTHLCLCAWLGRILAKGIAIEIQHHCTVVTHKSPDTRWFHCGDAINHKCNTHSGIPVGHGGVHLWQYSKKSQKLEMLCVYNFPEDLFQDPLYFLQPLTEKCWWNIKGATYRVQPSWFHLSTRPLKDWNNKPIKTWRSFPRFGPFASSIFHGVGAWCTFLNCLSVVVSILPTAPLLTSAWAEASL